MQRGTFLSQRGTCPTQRGTCFMQRGKCLTQRGKCLTQRGTCPTQRGTYQLQPNRLAGALCPLIPRVCIVDTTLLTLTTRAEESVHEYKGVGVENCVYGSIIYRFTIRGI